MQFVQTHITSFVSFLTVLSNLFFIVVFFGLVVSSQFRKKIYSFVYDNINWLIFGASITAVVFSLTYSEIVGYPPCDLCWYQRIFMYPQAILAFCAMLKKDKNIVSYLLPLSIAGIVVSFYHSLVHWRVISGSFLACTSSLTAPCAKVYVLEYGYVTIPFMAFTVFAYLIGISIIYYKARNARESI